MLTLAFEISSYVQAVVGLKLEKNWMQFIIPRYALVFDKLLYLDDPPEGDFLLVTPYGKFSALPSDFITYTQFIPQPSSEELTDYQLALGDEPEEGSGQFGYLGTMALMDYTQSVKAHFYVLPGLREGFVNFCSKHNQGFLAEIKKSFLLCSIVDFLFEQHIPAFDPIIAAENMKGFCDFKTDFQKGILSYADEFGSSYELSDEQKDYLKGKIANEERQLLEFLQPENLNQCNISKASIITDIMGLFVPLPLGTVVEAAKEIRRLETFERANLGFILSLTILKKIANVGNVEKPVNCAVCAISPAEIEKMTDQQCDDLMYSPNLCVPHMVARIDLKKRFQLYGKARLREMKRLGDASIWAKSPLDE